MSSSIPGPSRPDDGSGDDADEKGKFPSDAPAGTDSQKRRRKKRDKSDRNTVSLFGTASLIAPSKAGWLTKQGKVVKNWKKRWFVVRATFLISLTYFPQLSFFIFIFFSL
jgi:hypothetical protein